MAAPLENRSAASDLISFHKVLPDYRMRPGGARFPQWWMLLGALLASLRGPEALMIMVRNPNLQRTSLKERLGTRVTRTPWDSTYR